MDSFNPNNLEILSRYKKLIKKMDLLLIQYDSNHFNVKKFNEIIGEFESNNLLFLEQFENIKKIK